MSATHHSPKLPVARDSLLSSFERFSVSLSRSPPASPACEDRECLLTSCSYALRRFEASAPLSPRAPVRDDRCSDCGSQPICETRRSGRAVYHYCLLCSIARQESLDEYMREADPTAYADEALQDQLGELYRSCPEAFMRFGEVPPSSPVAAVGSPSLGELFAAAHSAVPQGGERLIGAKPDAPILTGQASHVKQEACDAPILPVSESADAEDFIPLDSSEETAAKAKKKNTKKRAAESKTAPPPVRKVLTAASCDYRQGLHVYGIYLAGMPSCAELSLAPTDMTLTVRNVYDRLSILARLWELATGIRVTPRQARAKPPAIYNYTRHLTEGPLCVPRLIPELRVHSDLGLCEHMRVYYCDSVEGAATRVYHAEVVLPPLVPATGDWDRAKSNRARQEISSDQERISCTTYLLTSARVEVSIGDERARRDGQKRLVAEMQRMLLSCTYCLFVGRGYVTACNCHTRVVLGPMRALSEQQRLRDWTEARNSCNNGRCKQQ